MKDTIVSRLVEYRVSHRPSVAPPSATRVEATEINLICFAETQHPTSSSILIIISAVICSQFADACNGASAFPSTIFAVSFLCFSS